MRGPGLFFSMVAQKTLTQDLFAIWLRPDPRREPAGEMTFGGINRSRFQGELRRIPVIPSRCARRSIAERTVGRTYHL